MRKPEVWHECNQSYKHGMDWAGYERQSDCDPCYPCMGIAGAVILEEYEHCGWCE